MGELGWALRAAEESGTCMGMWGQTRYCGLCSPISALPKVLTQQTSLHAAFSVPSSIFATFHWLIFLGHCTSWAHLQEILYLPKLAAEWGCVGGESPSSFSFYVCRGLSLATVFTSLLHLPASYRLSPLLTGHRDSGLPLINQVKKETCVCACVQVCVQPGRFSADVRMNTPVVPSGPFAASRLAGAA